MSLFQGHGEHSHGLRSIKIPLQHSFRKSVSIYPRSAPAAYCARTLSLVQILVFLFYLFSGCDPYRKVDKILLRQLGIKQVPWAILVNSGVGDQTKLSGEKKRF